MAAGPEERLASGDWRERAELGRAYLEAGAFAFGGAEGEGRDAGGAFAERVAAAEMLLHAGDDPGRDILEGSADVAFVGGFAAACAALGGKADLVMLDTTDPARPRARSLKEAVTRVVRGRAVNPRFIAGQMRHGPRGAAEFAETVDRLVGFAETTDAVAGALIEAVYAAYVADARVRAFLLHENPGGGAGDRGAVRVRAAAGAVASAAERGGRRPGEPDGRGAGAGGGGVSAAMRRGACPTLAAPMLTGDGWLVRLAPAAGLTAAQAAGLAAAAGRLGNGRIEVTGRGSVQVRGLTPETAGELGRVVEALGIAVRDGLR